MSHRPSPFRLPRVALMALSSLCVLPLSTAHAEAPPIKPGLWEITTENQLLDGKPMPDVSAQMAEQLKKMPPEMRKQMEAHMKSQGVQLAPGGRAAVRLCLTREMLDQDRWQNAQGQCQNTGTSRSGKAWSWKFKCTQPPGEGEGTTTFQGPDAYTSEMKMHTQRQGQAHEMTLRHRGRWIGADCGDVKPITPAAAAKAAKP